MIGLAARGALFVVISCAASNDGSLLSGCTADDECLDGSQCFSPGACNAGEEEVIDAECASNEDCGADLVCQPSAAGCGFTAGSACVASCASRGCADGEVCDEAIGVCSEASCVDTFTCPDFTHCDTASGAANGCDRDTCAASADCGDGVCVNGACFEGPGECDWNAP